MPRTVKKYEVSEIRDFTKKNNGNNSYISPWIPSFGGPDSFKNTFTLGGKNVIPSTGQVLEQSSKGEINILTDFAINTLTGAPQKDENDINLKRFTLFLYCLRHDPYFFSGIDSAIRYDSNNALFTQALQSFLMNYQTGKTNENFSKSLVADIVRTYRGSRLKESLDNENSIQSFLDYSRRPNGDYQKNVAGVLGKVTYDSIVKHTLYSLLLKNGIINDYSKPLGTPWIEIANKLSVDQYDLFVDVNGGPYKRAFPVICVITKAEKGKNVDDLIDGANKLIESKFYRTPTGKDQLVTEIKVGNEKNFIESPISLSGQSVYCIIYDFTKVIVLEPSVANDYTLSLLKIGLSLFKRKQLKFNDINEFKSFYEKVRDYLEASISKENDKLSFEIILKNKHSKECEYLLNKDSAALSPKISRQFKLELKSLWDSIDNVYETIINIFNNQVKEGDKQNFQFKDYNSQIESPIILYFDNFYNLLAVNSKNTSPQNKPKKYDDTLPFVIEDYVVNFTSDDLVVKFFSNDKTLPVFGNGEYTFAPSVALEEDIVFVTDAFIKQLYYNLDNSSKNFVFETDKNQNEDNVLTAQPFNLLGLIQQRTDITLKKSDYFFVSTNNVYLRKEIVRKLELKELNFLFESVREDKIKFQTIAHFLFISTTKDKINLDDLTKDIYYPKIIEKTSPTPDPDPDPKKPDPDKKPPKNNNYLINNIISSELKCYEDIANAFDTAINAESVYDRVYFAGKSLLLIGLPFLLNYASEAIADKLSKLSKDKINSNLLECLLQDSEDLKKMIVGAVDIATSDNPEQLLLQAVPQISTIPAIPYIAVFDLEKELKRRLIEFIISEIIKLLKEQLNIAIQPIIDMCNSDSYLTAFLNSAIPNLDNLGNKLASPTPSGLVGGSNVSTYIPNLTVNINELIEQSGIETTQKVYEEFRTNYFIKLKDYSDINISDFFDFISDKIDAGQMVTLLKSSSNPQTRNLLLSYIQEYKVEDDTVPNKFAKIINDEQDVGFLFLFLSEYIDYRLILELISSSLTDFTPSVCVNIESRFDELSSVFTPEQINDVAIDLENSLADICSLKKSPVIDIYAKGPPILTETLNNAFQIGFDAVVDSIEKSLGKKSIGEGIKELSDIPELDFEKFISTTILETKDPYIGVLTPNKDFYYKHLMLNKGPIFTTAAGPNNVPGFFGLSKSEILKSINTNINEDRKIRKENYKKMFTEELKNSGNVGLKTQETIFADYIEKYNSLKGIKIY